MLFRSAKFSKIFQATDSSKKLVSIWLLAENDVDKDLNVYGYPYFSEKLLGKEFQIYPRSFFQINSKQVEKTYSILVEFIAQEKTKTKRTLYDLYCGTGTIGLILSEYFTQVKGIEIFPDSVSNAKQNAKINKISNATFHLGKAEKWLINQDVDKADTIIVNPPRKGLAKSLVDTLNQVKASSLIYISCHPGTLARDLKTLKAK